MKTLVGAVSCVMLGMGAVLAQEASDAGKLEVVKLNAPQLDKGAPTMQALKNRKSTREFSETKLSLQQLSELVWAANGINRDTGQRTAPSALGKHPVDVYVVLEEGIYLYGFEKHELIPVAEGDFRKEAGTQEFVHGAPVNLVYVADYTKLDGLKAPDEEKASWVSIEAGAQAQNVYLYCASEGLATVIRASIDKDAFAKAANLRPEQKVVIAQTVGQPKS